MRRRHQGVTGEPAPRGQVGRRAGIERDETEHGARLKRLNPESQLQYELPAAEVAGIPGGVRDHPINFASASSFGSTASRGSDGRPKMARSTPAAAT